MARIAFADESGTHEGTKCYTIGVISFEADKLACFEEHFQKLIQGHGVVGEAKWGKISNSHGLVNFVLDCLNAVLHSKTASFDAIVVNKDLFRNWEALEHEEAFYQTYTYLLRHITRRDGDTEKVFIDERSDSYPKRHEVVETISNRMLAQLASRGRIESIEKVNSKSYVGIQVADVLTGAMNSGHQCFLDPATEINTAKRVTIQRLSAMLGWNDLCYDTMPSPRFNIWHFPQEYRACPKTQEVKISSHVPYVKPGDII